MTESKESDPVSQIGDLTATLDQLTREQDSAVELIQRKIVDLIKHGDEAACREFVGELLSCNAIQSLPELAGWVRIVKFAAFLSFKSKNDQALAQVLPNGK